jgi:phospho-N-acetylmuramoyl-pentapeptide-transferase
MISDIVKIALPGTIAFIVGVLLAPPLAGWLYRRQMWKKQPKTIATDGRGTPIFSKLHETRETTTPKLGGLLIWGSTLITVVGIWFISQIFDNEVVNKVDFLSRSQTWLPLFAMVIGGIVGFTDDLLDIRGAADHIAGGLSLSKRLLVVGLIGLLAALWFYTKLETQTIGIPFVGDIDLGFLFVPFFIIVMLALYSGGVIDGLDGLAGGIFATMFSAYAGIAFFQDQINLAAFCVSVVGALLAFLWFNIPPARFYMSETGSMALTVSLAVVAFMTDSLSEGHGVFVLPIIAFPLVVTTASVIVQLVSKKFRNGKKVFMVAPLHHHFEALGWPPYKVVMRYWVFGAVVAIIGLIIGVIGQ